MGQLGDLLREAREAKGISLQQVEKITNIRVKLLQALEQEAYEELPAPVFVKGFLRNYARALGLDPEQAVALYKETVGDADRPYELKALSEPLEDPASRAPWFLAAFVVIALGLLAWWGYRQGLLKLPAWPWAARLAATATAPATATLAQAAAPTGAAPTGALPTDTAQPTLTASSTHTSQPTDAPTTPAPPTATLTLTPAPTNTATVSPTPTLAETATPALSPTATLPPSDAPIQVTLISQMSVWLRVYADGAKVFEGMMDQGATQTWTAERQLYVHCGYANGVRAVVNGREYGVLGPQADTVRVEWALAAGTPSVSSVVSPTQVVVTPNPTRAP